jgi:predicted acyl esterase
MHDEEIMAVPALREALQNPGTGTNALIVDMLLHPFDGPFWRERSARDENGKTPAFLGACWGNYGLHLPGAFDAWQKWQGPKKMVIGPPIYLDRPVYQYHDEALRWFDHWLKNIDTRIMDEPPIRCFIPATGEWKALQSGRRPRRAGRHSICTRTGCSASTSFGPPRVRTRLMNQISNTAG